MVTASGAMIAAIPIPRPRFAMFDPTTFAKLKSALPAIAENIETMNSGKLVPNATTDNPIRIGETLNDPAMSDAPSMSQSAPFKRTIRDTTKMIILIIIQCRCCSHIITIRLCTLLLYSIFNVHEDNALHLTPNYTLFHLVSGKIEI